MSSTYLHSLSARPLSGIRLERRRHRCRLGPEWAHHLGNERINFVRSFGVAEVQDNMFHSDLAQLGLHRAKLIYLTGCLRQRSLNGERKLNIFPGST